MTRILLTGITGQVGQELQRALAPLGDVIGVDRRTIDLTQPTSIRQVISEVKPEAIVNAAAYTAVDKAETETELALPHALPTGVAHLRKLAGRPAAPPGVYRRTSTASRSCRRRAREGRNSRWAAQADT